jgi:uncharacterized membrane protein SpoIIM required for sporulation
LISTSWLEKRKPHWNRLEALLDQVRSKGLKSLSRDDLRDLGLLYRQTAADMAVLRGDSSSAHFAQYLNQLLSRAHNIIYSNHKTNPSAILHFFTKEYPLIFRRNLQYVLIAFILFLGGVVVGTMLTVQNPDFQLKVIGPQMAETIQRREMWTHSVVAIKPLASSSIMTNNLSVAFTTFAAGITAGLGTIYMIVFNGLLMGVIGTACAQARMSQQLWSFVAPHGVLELPAIFIAAGAGLRLASGWLFPGVLPRLQSLAIAGREAVRLLLGALPMLFVAGIIEAFVSPTELAVKLKFLLAAALFALLCLYLSGFLSNLSAPFSRRIKAGSVA